MEQKKTEPKQVEEPMPEQPAPRPASKPRLFWPVVVIATVILTGGVVFLFQRMAGQTVKDTAPAVLTITPIPVTTATDTPATPSSTATSAPTTTTTPSATPVSDGSSSYQNSTYGFGITYSQPYEILDDTDSLSGYPNGIALVYMGGQAYDIVVEVWDSQAEYEAEYGPRMSEVTVHEVDGKFITLLHNTGENGNQEIIDSFALLP